jgi:cholera toxin transcriptional activator
MPAPTSSQKFRFGPYEANAATGELRKHGLRLKLAGQPFQILIMLLERPAELVTRDEIRNRLWPEGTFVDFDHSLNSAMNKLRDALSDAAGSPRYIETLARRGYRFIAPVESDAPAPAATPEVTATDTAAIAQRSASVHVLTREEELPHTHPRVVRTLFLLAQIMYLGFYIGALANLGEIRDLLSGFSEQHAAWFTVLITTAVIGIATRLFLISATGFRVDSLRRNFLRLFPALLVLDLIWACSPFLMVEHIGAGLAFAACAALLLVPFGERTLVLMMRSEATKNATTV